MNVPTQLLLGGVPYAVEVLEGNVAELKNGYTVTGEIQYSDQRIQLSGLLQPEYASKVLLHEAIHGILHEYGMEKYNKEDLVDRLTHALYDFIQRNDLDFIRDPRGRKKVLEKIQKIAPIKAVGIEETGHIEYAVKDDFSHVADGHGKINTPGARSPELEKVVSRSRQLPYVDPAPGTFKLEELAKISEQPQDHWETGIKMKDGVKTYRTRYECPICADKGKRYLPKDDTQLYCRECGTALEIRTATDEPFPARDTWGNFFVADSLVVGEAAD
ncbi:hypothetical protein [Lysinibacillus sp. 54212]|uniref:hypothetical protein n=1 Tax=Lysinibacillus sp. 54212 TaxID=3119829 RepID=UPI002FCC3F0F